VLLHLHENQLICDAVKELFQVQVLTVFSWNTRAVCSEVIRESRFEGVIESTFAFLIGVYETGLLTKSHWSGVAIQIE